jgi:hypothetical protein
MVRHPCNSIYTGGTGRKITESESLSEKTTKTKRAEGMASVIKCLPSPSSV